MNTIAHNISAMNAQRQFGINSKAKTKSIEKLSSGFRINRAADDAAGLAISEKMRSQIRGLSQGTRNVQDGISLLQVADGALSEVSEMLHRIKELSVQAANGTNTDTDREFIEDEVFLLLEAIDEISEDTEFNTIPLFNIKNQITENAKTEVVDSLSFSKLSVTGTPTDTIAKTYTIKADENGFSINTDRFSWDVFENGTATLADNPLTGGTYSFVYHGFTLSLTADNDATMNDLIERMDGASFTTRLSGSTSANKIKTTGFFDGNYKFSSPLPSTVEIKLHADDTGIWTTFDGAVYSAMIGGEISYWHNQSYMYGDGYNMADTNSHLIYLSPSSTRLSDGSIRDTDPLWVTAGIESVNGATKQDLINALNGATVHVELDTYYSDASRNRYYYQITGIDLNATPSTSPNKPYLDHVTQGGDISITSDDVESTGYGLWIQAGANEGQGMWLTINNMSTSILGIDDVDVSTTDGATKAIVSVREALAKVTKNRSIIGAQQNRLEHTFAREEIAVENLSASESRIRDADMALEMTEYAKINILEQVSQSMMAQANQNERRVLDLLSM